MVYIDGASSNHPQMTGLDALPTELNNHSEKEQTTDTSSLFNELGRELSMRCLLYVSRSDYGVIASLNKSFRSLVKSGELYKLRREAGIVEHLIYFSCELLEWDVFDPIRSKWMRLPRMFANPCFMWSDKESLAVGTELLVFGRDIHSNVIHRYSILTNEWAYGQTQMTCPRCLFASASFGGIAIVAGGCDENATLSICAELYSSETETWTLIPSMKRARKFSSGAFMDGKFYVVGGVGPNDIVLTDAEVYDLKTRTWHQIPNMYPLHSHRVRQVTCGAPPLLAVVNNQLYTAEYEQRQVMRYDKETNTWTPLGFLPERASSSSGWGIAFRACGDRLIVIGAPVGSRPRTIEIFSWIPNEGPLHWEVLGSKPSLGFVYNCAIMGC